MHDVVPSNPSLTIIEKPLGYIKGVRFGHDNSGNSPSWFLEEIISYHKTELFSHRREFNY